LDLYLLRHGEAGNRVPIAARDMERSLTAAGKKEIEDVGEGMADMNYKFDVVASSPLKRAMETASIVNKELKRKIPVEEWTELSPEGSREAFYRRLGKLKAGSSVLCVGHEPYLTTIIGEITGREGAASPGFRIALKKGGLAKLSVDGFTPRASGELRWLLTPKQIRKMG
jgi:phosphohistidine phosphatase